MILIAIGFVILAGSFTSTTLDSLERTAQMVGTIEGATDSNALFARYLIEGINHPNFSITASGIIGVILIFLTFWSIAWARHIDESIKRFFARSPAVRRKH